MRSRRATVLLLLVTAATLTSCGKSKEEHADAIRSVISQDNASSPKLGVWESIFGASQSTIDNYVLSLKSLDLTRCPKGFQEAYNKHIRAWDDYADASRAGASLDSPRRAIEDTWFDVHHIAEEYGVSDALSR